MDGYNVNMTKWEEKVRDEISEEGFAKYSVMTWAVIIFCICWSVVGLIAFIYSLVCFGKSGSLGQNILGVVLAVLFGPFYFIYYASSKTYCS